MSKKLYPKFIFNSQEYKIKRTNHLYEKRKTSEYQRDAFLDDTRFVKIFKLALQNGLSSFRNKGEVVVTVPNYNNKFYNILCSLDENNKITVITVWFENKYFWKPFITCQQRINLVYAWNSELYKVPKMNQKEKQFKDLDSLCYNIRKTGEDLTFRNVMDNFIDKRF